MLVASSGGHLAHLLWLRRWWSQHARVWVSFDTPDAVGALEDEAVVWAPHPTNRHPRHLVANLVLALRTLPRERPDVLVTSGAGVAVPWAIAAWSLGIPVVYLEVVDRFDAPSLSGRLVAPFADRVVLQTEAQRRAWGRGLVLGAIR